MFRTLRVVVFRDNQRFAEAGQGVIDGLNSKNDVTKGSKWLFYDKNPLEK